MTGLLRLCGECGGRADYVIEPVGRYDWAGWAEAHACDEHIGDVAKNYIGDDMPRVQVRFWDVPPVPEPTECICEGCDNLVGDTEGWCLNCERDITDAIAKESNR
jgi:hypothetical protein